MTAQPRDGGDDASFKRPLVSVIVPVRDDWRIGLCIDAVQAQTYPAHLIEIVVADNGSGPDFVRHLSRFGSITVVDEPMAGSYRARNAAAAVCVGEVLAFTDADCIPDAHWVERSVAAICEGADVVCGGVEVFARRGRLHPIEAYELVHAFPQERYVRKHGGGVTANLVVSRRAFAVVGPFNSDLLSGADIEWGQRARTAGVHAAFVESAMVRHPARRRFSQMSAKISRVVGGSRARRQNLPGGEVSVWPALRELRPPLGAARRARQLPGGPTAWNVVALFVGETFCRYLGAWHQLRVRIVRRDT